MEGNYFCDEATLAELKRDNRIVFRYANPQGEITPKQIPTDRWKTSPASAARDATCWA